jgi:hypothetical protein
VPRTRIGLRSSRGRAGCHLRRRGRDERHEGRPGRGGGRSVELVGATCEMARKPAEVRYKPEATVASWRVLDRERAMERDDTRLASRGNLC